VPDPVLALEPVSVWRTNRRLARLFANVALGMVVVPVALLMVIGPVIAVHVGQKVADAGLEKARGS